MLSGGTSRSCSCWNLYNFISLCKSPTLLRAVGAGFARSYRLCEGNELVLVATNIIYRRTTFISSNKKLISLKFNQ